jgi:hypothetical protein
MNADTRHPHLDLDDLIASAAGQSMDGPAREHLGRCEHCQREASRWNLVADGVRGLEADALETPQPAWPPRSWRTRRRAVRHVPAGPVRRTLLVAGSVAAALVLLVVVGEAAGVMHVRFGNSGTEPAALTAVNGCSQLEQARGTLSQVNGNSLVIKTASGQPVTVTTFVSMSGAPLSDITDGASVMVRGSKSGSGGAIQAAIVTVGQPFNAVNPSGFVAAQGTVADAGTGGFTLVMAGGARIQVATSGGTLVVVPHASLSQMSPGATIYALGHGGPDGTLAARAVAAVTQVRPGGHTSVSVKDCSASSITEALGAISVAPGSAG